MSNPYLRRSLLNPCLACVVWFCLVANAMAQRVGLLDHRIPAYLQFSDLDFTCTPNSKMAAITVMRTGEYREPVSVQYSTSDGSAIADLDYTTTAGTLTIPAGTSVANFSVPILNTARSSMTVQLKLSSPSSNAIITRAAATLTIVEETVAATSETPPVLSVQPDGQGHVIVSWRPGTWKCTLEKSHETARTVWQQVEGVVRTLDGCSTISEPAAEGCSFYRLRVQ